MTIMMIKVILMLMEVMLRMMMEMMMMFRLRNLSDSGSDSVLPVFAVWKLIKGAHRA